MKVLYLTNLPAPYRMKFFNELGKFCDLTVLVERMTATNRDDKWLDSVESAQFKMICLKSIKIGEESSISLDVLRYLRQDYDFVVIGGYSTFTAMLAILYLKMHRRAFILNADGGFPNLQENKISRAVKTFFISSAAAWITTSSDARSYFAFYGAKEEQIYIYPFTSIMGQNLQMVSQDEKRKYKEKLGVPQSSKMLLTVGQIIHRKGLDVLLDAVSRLSGDYCLYIVGGNPTPELAQLMEEKNLKNVSFVEFQAEDALSEYYKAADAFVFPTRFDVWGLVVNEAMSYGLPVISSDAAGAAREMIRSGENGILFPNEDAQAMAQCIADLFSDEQRVAQISRNAYQTAQAFTIEEMAQKHYDIFTELKDVR